MCRQEVPHLYSTIIRLLLLLLLYMYIFFCKTIWRNAYAKTSNGRLSTRFHVLRPAVSRLNRRTAYKGAVHTNLTKMVKLTDGLVTFSTDNPADCRCFDVTPMGSDTTNMLRVPAISLKDFEYYPSVFVFVRL